MEQDWAKEPWRIDGIWVMSADKERLHPILTTGLDHYVDQDCVPRIVACVNACTGIPTDSLEIPYDPDDVIKPINNKFNFNDPLPCIIADEDEPVVEIRQEPDHDGKMMCSDGCHSAEPCNLIRLGTDMGDSLVVEDCYIKAGVWESCNRHGHSNKYNEMCPGPNCPGPGKYKLVRVGEE